MEFSPTTNQTFLLLFLVTGLHSIYLAILLFWKSKEERQIRWLGFSMCILACWLLNYLFYISNVIYSVPHIMGVFVPVLYLLGPVFYFFIRFSLPSNTTLKWHDMVHLVPALYVLVEWIPIFQLPADVKTALINQVFEHSRPSLWQLFWGNRLIWILLGYVAFCWFYLKKRRKDPLQIQWLERINWLLNFTGIFSVFIGLFIVVILSCWIFYVNAAAFELTMVLVLSLAIHLLGYVVLGKKNILPEVLNSRKMGKYATSPLSDQQISDILDRIKACFEVEKPWLNQNFSIFELSEKLAIPSHHISQTLNMGRSVKFNDLVNSYRVEAVKKRLDLGDAEKYSLSGIAAECGFGSKSSFHRAFKKFTGTTPSMYLKGIHP